MPKHFGNVEATSYVELRTASPLPPPTLKDVHLQAQSLGTYPPGSSTTPTMQYYKVPYFYLTSLCLRDLPGPPRNPFKGHTSSSQPLLGHSCPRLQFP
ncbi:hypothetical protein F5877DRAFT_86704 [Lentinula edodes]|nr:hypothetical protein F5877DRAFT_86704 [Lentinula edodes]